MNRCFSLSAIAAFTVSMLAASEHRGQVLFQGLPVPGALVTASRYGGKSAAITDPQGFYSFPDLTDGVWTIAVDMFGFEPVKQDITIAPNASPAKWELKMLPLDRLTVAIQSSETPVQTAAVSAARKRPEERSAEAPAEELTGSDLQERAAEGFLINGSMNNAADSPFAPAAAFGNNRAGGKNLYNGGIGFLLGNSALDARPFSLTGQNTPRPAYNRMTGAASFGGPLQIPHLFRNGPNFFAGYQWTRNNNATAASALLPSLAQRNGIFASPVLDPLAGAPFPGNAIPETRVSPQARALLGYYPFPNFSGSAGYNYQIPIVASTHQDALQSRLMKTLDSRNQLSGHFSLQSARTDDPNLFGFLSTTRLMGINTGANWWRRLNQQWFLNFGFQFSRLSTRVKPYFADRENVSALAGISGNNQDPMNWGPPNLNFSSGIAGLSDAQGFFNRSQTSEWSSSMRWNRRGHNISLGGDFRRQQFNYLSQQDPRGTFSFTGAETGSDFGDFLLGIPATASIAFGNADKYLREPVYAAYAADDWRISQKITLNAGVRWEYGAPVTELYGRLVNLDIAPGFAATAPVVAGSAAGALTGGRYPNSLVRAYRRGVEPRAGVAWRPVAGSSLVLRAGYGVYYDTSVYQAVALRMAQQPPLSKTFSVQNSAANPLTLANGFGGSSAGTANTFAIDPSFRPGYAQNWQLSVQRDLPGALQLTAAYLGTKGTRAMQAFLPNTFPAGAATPCPACPAGFVYLVSSGNSSREAAQIQLRRRLHSGLAAILQYTFSKSIDDAASLGGLGASANAGSAMGQSASVAAPSGGGGSLRTGMEGLAIAQNWLDLRAERGLSAFDQRHLLSLQMQYTTGIGIAGGTLLSGWKGVLLKEWTLSAQITAGSGLPQTPVYLAPVPGTGVTGTIRPDYTGAPVYATAPGLFLNPAAYTPPRPGYWGDAGRNSITGPAQLTLNASLGRTFRLSDRLNLDLRADSSNALNRVTFTAWNTTVNSPQFGLPAAANAMRTMQISLRLRF